MLLLSVGGRGAGGGGAVITGADFLRHSGGFSNFISWPIVCRLGSGDSVRVKDFPCGWAAASDNLTLEGGDSVRAADLGCGWAGALANIGGWTSAPDTVTVTCSAIGAWL